jgi:hypothetical protein
METGTDGRLRQALEPDRESVERIVRGALAERRPARAWRLVPAAVGAAALVALAALFLGRPEPKARVSIENVGEVLIVRHLEEGEGGRWRIHNGDAGTGSPPSGSMIVVRGGTR